MSVYNKTDHPGYAIIPIQRQVWCTKSEPFLQNRLRVISPAIFFSKKCNKHEEIIDLEGAAIFSHIIGFLNITHSFTYCIPPCQTHLPLQTLQFLLYKCPQTQITNEHSTFPVLSGPVLLPHSFRYCKKNDCHDTPDNSIYWKSDYKRTSSSAMFKSFTGRNTDKSASDQDTRRCQNRNKKTHAAWFFSPLMCYEKLMITLRMHHHALLEIP